jgi:hypothetical protein
MEPRRTYISLLGSNSLQTSWTTPILAQVDETRQPPVVQRTENFDISVERIELATTALPAFRAPAVIGQSDPFLTPYVVQFNLDAYVPTTIPVPASPWMGPSNPPTTIPVTVSVYLRGRLFQSVAAPVTFNPPVHVDVGTWVTFLQTSLTTATGLPIVIRVAAIGNNLNWNLFDQPLGPQDVEVLISCPPLYASFFGFKDAVLLNGDVGIRIQSLNDKDHYVSSPLAPFELGWPAIGALSPGPTNLTLVSKSVTWPIRWTPQNQNMANPPNAPLTSQDASNIAYWAWDYAHVLNVFNQNFQSAWLQLLQSINPAVNPVMVVPPQLSLDTTTDLISLTVDATCFASSQTPDGTSGGMVKASIQMNGIFNDLFGLPCTVDARTGMQTIVFGKKPLVVTPYTPESPHVYGIRSPTTTTTADASCLGLWSPVAAIAFQTNCISVRPQVKCTPAVYTDMRTTPQGGGLTTSSGVESVLSDFAPIITRSSDWRRTTLIYSPQIPRYFDGVGGAMTRVDLKIFYIDKSDGKTYELKLGPGGYLNVKLRIQERNESAV